MVVEVNEENFEEIVSSEKLVAIDFWAEWCGPCKSLSPVIDEMSNEFNDIRFGKLNVENAPDITDGLKIKNVPTVFFFKSGEEVGRVVGRSSRNHYEKIILEYK